MLLFSAVATSQAQAANDRLAIVVGNNVGSPGRTPLRFAEDDARRFARVVSELGSVKDVRLLVGGSPDALRRLMEDVRRRTAVKAPPVILFFYSGHADPTGLEMGSQKMPFAELQKSLSTLGAELTVAFVDACHSGRIARTKGGRAVPVTVDVAKANTYKGQVLITSSAAGESAYEADSLGASVFSHYLMTGLAGAADRSGDREVSLSEAYAFAYQNTLARSAQATAGGQHPVLDMNVRGHGELVLTELKKGRSYLNLGKGIQGQLTVRAGAGGRVVADLMKRSGATSLLAVPPGLYQIIEVRHGRRRSGLVAVSDARTRRVTSGMLQPVGSVAIKGGGSIGEAVRVGDEAFDEDDRPRNRVFLGYGIRSGYLQDSVPVNRARLGYARRLGPVALGITLAYGRAEFARTDGISVTQQEFGGAVVLGVPVDLASWAAFVPELALEGGWVQQAATAVGMGDSVIEASYFEYRLRAAFQFRAGVACLSLAAHVGQVVYPGPDGTQAPFAAGGTASIGVLF